MLSINTNTLSLNSQRRLNAAQGALARTLERLSSGLRVNGARDDAAGLAVAQRMSADIGTNAKLQQGIGDGVSLVQTAEGGLSSVHELLQRLRELAIQSANGTWSDRERAAINAEAVQLRDEIDRIADTTRIFDIYPLRGETLSPPPLLGNIPHLNAQFASSGSGGSFSSGVVPLVYIPTGSRNVTIDIDSLGQDDDIQLFTRSGQHLVGTPITGSDPDYVWTHNNQGALITDDASAAAVVLTEANGFLAGATYDGGSLFEGPASYAYPGGASTTLAGMSLTYTGDGDRSEGGVAFNNGVNNDPTMFREALTVGEATQDLLVMVVGSGSFTATASWDFVPPAGVVSPVQTIAPTRILLAAPADSPPVFANVERTPADTATLGIAGLDLSTAAGAIAAVAALDQATGTISAYRATYGAHASNFEKAIDQLRVAHENASAARSRIMDADFAAETASLAQQQILRDAATAMLAQANQLPQQVLVLLRR